MRGTWLSWALVGLASAGCGAGQPGAAALTEEAPAEVRGLKNAASFAGIADEKARAVALFTEAGKVFTHARCVNCHPASERPLQTDAQRPHNPPVVRGQSGHGVVGLRCATCHRTQNAELGGWSVPGHPAWHLAPASMGWEGKSLNEICLQIKDPSRNGGRELEAVVHHMAEDSLVGWAWDPGSGRVPAPGTQRVFGTLVTAWMAAGAGCPDGAPAMASTN